MRERIERDRVRPWADAMRFAGSLIGHKHYIAQHGDDMPALSGWKWATKASVGPRGTSTEGDNV